MSTVASSEVRPETGVRGIGSPTGAACCSVGSAPGDASGPAAAATILVSGPGRPTIVTAINTAAARLPFHRDGRMAVLDIDRPRWRARQILRSVTVHGDTMSGVRGAVRTGPA